MKILLTSWPSARTGEIRSQVIHSVGAATHWSHGLSQSVPADRPPGRQAAVQVFRHSGTTLEYCTASPAGGPAMTSVKSIKRKINSVTEGGSSVKHCLDSCMSQHCRNCPLCLVWSLWDPWDSQLRMSPQQDDGAVMDPVGISWSGASRICQLVQLL